MEIERAVFPLKILDKRGRLSVHVSALLLLLIAIFVRQINPTNFFFQERLQIEFAYKKDETIFQHVAYQQDKQGEFFRVRND